MVKDILSDILNRWLGVPQAPAKTALAVLEHACGVAFSLPVGRCSFTPRRKNTTASRDKIPADWNHRAKK